MSKQYDSKTNKQKPTKDKKKEIIVEEYFLGEFTLEDYLLKEANRIIAKLK